MCHVGAFTSCSITGRPPLGGVFAGTGNALPDVLVAGAYLLVGGLAFRLAGGEVATVAGAPTGG